MNAEPHLTEGKGAGAAVMATGSPAGSESAPAHQTAPGLQALLYAVPAAIRAAWRAWPGEGGVWATPGMAAAAVAAFALGFVPTWWLSSVMNTPAFPEAAGIAVSFLIDVFVLSALLMCLPMDVARPWGFLQAWLRCTLLAAAAMAGLLFAPASGISWSNAWKVLALISAQAAALGGCAGLLTWLSGGRCRAVRMCMALLLALLASSLLWTKPLLLPPYGKEHPRQRVMLIRGVLALGPLTSLAGAWHEMGSDFDLIKGTNTYSLWIGSYYLAEYAKLWPSRQERVEDAQGKARADHRETYWSAFLSHGPGLVLGAGLWGLALLAWSDFLGFVWQAARARQGGKRA